jgi:hypothetical protein
MSELWQDQVQVVKFIPQVTLVEGTAEAGE